MAYDARTGLYLPQFGAAVTGGLQAGQDLRKGALNIEAARRAQEQKAALGALAPRIAAGEQAAVNQALQIDPTGAGFKGALTQAGARTEQAATQKAAQKEFLARSAFDILQAPPEAQAQMHDDMIHQGIQSGALPQEAASEIGQFGEDDIIEMQSLVRGGQEFKDVVGTAKGSLQERKLEYQIRDLERKEQNSLQQEKLLESLLGRGPSDSQIVSSAIETNISSGVNESIAQLQQERDRLLPALTNKGVVEVVKSKISQIDNQIKFQRSLDKEKRKLEEKMTPEQAGKVSLIRSGANQLEEAIKLITDKSGKFNDIDVANLAIGTPFTTGRNARGLMLNAINAQLRSESGAAVPEEEVERAFQRFVPRMGDNQKTRQAKVDSLRALFKETERISKGPAPLKTGAVFAPDAIQAEIARRKAAGQL